MNTTGCQHIDRILVSTDGLGSWQVTETYRCAACGTVLPPVPVELESYYEDEE